MHKIKIMNKEKILQCAPSVLTALHEALKQSVIQSFTAKTIVGIALENPEDTQIYEIIDDSAKVVGYGVTRVYAYSTHVELNVLCLTNIGGDFFEDEIYNHLLSEMEDLARTVGFNKLSIVGRLGWKRKLQPMGFELDYITMSKEL